MRLLKAGLIAALLGSATASDAGAQPAPPASACADVALPRPQITVRAELTTEPPIDRSLDVLSLTRMARERASGLMRGRVVGLTTADFDLEIEELRLASIPVASGVCTRPTRLRLRLAARQKVFIVRSMRHDNCWEAAVLEHEMQHVAFNNEAVQSAAAAAARQLETLLARPVAAREPAAAGRAVSSIVQGAIDEASRQAFAVARKKHAAIDTPRAYDKLRARCGI